MENYLKFRPALPSTINLHFIRPCNGRCNYCFAGFEDLTSHRLNTNELSKIIQKIAQAPLANGIKTPRRKINFVGGEPTLAPDLPILVQTAKKEGLVTSIVTNGYNLLHTGVNAYAETLDMLGVSIDSLNPKINRRIGRVFSGNTISETEWIHLFDQARQLGIELKINTVVNRQNVDENMSAFIQRVLPQRWKIFQVLPVNNSVFSREWKNICVSVEEFQNYIQRHQTVSSSGVKLIAEDNTLMSGSYAMISPDGRFFDTTTGTHLYSDPILKIGLEEAFSQIHFSIEKFRKRGGEYNLKEKSLINFRKAKSL